MAGIEGKSLDERKSHFKNLVAVALADGKLEPPEKKLLQTLGLKWQLDADEVETVLENPSACKFRPPADQESRAEQLVDMVWMMMCDGDISNNEADVCIRVANAMRFPAEKVDEIVNRTIEAFKQGNGQNEAAKQILELF